MKCTVYETGALGDYKYVVTFAFFKGKWIFCKHKARKTWEVSGGHIEEGETPAAAARRELHEETGALEFTLTPVCDYWACDEPHEKENVSWSNGAVFLARVETLGDIPESEMEKIQLFEEPPPHLTYPDITNALFPHILQQLSPKPTEACLDLKFSDMQAMQRQLHEKHAGKWAELKPDYGRSCLLWMLEELGEAVSVIKKRGETHIMADPAVRAAFIEELADVLMFMTDALLCYGVTAYEFSNAFFKKHQKNMGRDWEKEEALFLTGASPPQ
jgi:8-oxo-dGTP pyrophosphatase MutT (NUDIX family)/NTP pyrophosphatase (non-canonical NTP hydrolase)